MVDQQGIRRAVFVGTSRGGILTMVLGAVRREVIAGAVLNDIGPVIEIAGLMRIKSYVGRLPRPRDHIDAARILRSVMGNHFPGWSDPHWDLYARRTFEEVDGALVPRYDPALSHALDNVDLKTPPPELWPQFDALGDAPILVVRGEHSDILSRATVAAMRTRRGGIDAIEIAGEGHAPLLTEPHRLTAIRDFILRCDP